MIKNLKKIQIEIFFVIPHGGTVSIDWVRRPPAAESYTLKKIEKKKKKKKKISRQPCLILNINYQKYIIQKFTFSKTQFHSVPIFQVLFYYFKDWLLSYLKTNLEYKIDC